MTLKEEISKRRTFGIISHPDAGKTTLTEKLLLFGGAIQTAGAVKHNKIKKAATSDFMEIEKQRGIFSKAKVNPFTPGRPSENRFKNQGSSQLCLLCGDTTSKESVWRRDQHHSYMFGRTGASVIDFGTNLSIQKRRQEEDARAQLQQQLKAASKVAHISLWENQGEQVAQRTQVRQMELRPICLVAS